jgi:hypothetical protein
MDFLREVEQDLRALSAEARKRHPVVKEAAERGILKLRAMREQYAQAIKVLYADTYEAFCQHERQHRAWNNCERWIWQEIWTGA